LVYTTEKLIKENGDKVPADLKTQAEDLIKQGKEVVEKEEFDKMQALTDELNKLSHKMAEQMYKAAAEKQAPGAAAGTAGAGATSDVNGHGKKPDDVVDAEIVDEGKK
jgi:molecular chaperone DnaK